MTSTTDNGKQLAKHSSNSAPVAQTLDKFRGAPYPISPLKKTELPSTLLDNHSLMNGSHGFSCGARTFLDVPAYVAQIATTLLKELLDRTRAASQTSHRKLLSTLSAREVWQTSLATKVRSTVVGEDAGPEVLCGLADELSQSERSVSSTASRVDELITQQLRDYVQSVLKVTRDAMAGRPEAAALVSETVRNTLTSRLDSYSVVDISRALSDVATHQDRLKEIKKHRDRLPRDVFDQATTQLAQKVGEKAERALDMAISIRLNAAWSKWRERLIDAIRKQQQSGADIAEFRAHVLSALEAAAALKQNRVHTTQSGSVVVVQSNTSPSDSEVLRALGAGSRTHAASMLLSKAIKDCEASSVGIGPPGSPVQRMLQLNPESVASRILDILSRYLPGTSLLATLTELDERELDATVSTWLGRTAPTAETRFEDARLGVEPTFFWSLTLPTPNGPKEQQVFDGIVHVAREHFGETRHQINSEPNAAAQLWVMKAGLPRVSIRSVHRLESARRRFENSQRS